MDRTMDEIREGMQVYSSDERLLGTVEGVGADGIRVGGRTITDARIARVTQNRVYLEGVYDELAGASTASMREGDVTRVPVYEERLEVEKRAGQTGEVTLNKTVEHEEVSVPVELRRDEVHVERREVADRPVEAGAIADAFEEKTIRVPVRGEEAVVEKQVYQTGEVTIDKEQVVERQEIRDTVRRERVDIDEAYKRYRGDFEADFSQRTAAAGSTGQARTFEQAEPNYRMGIEAALDERYREREFDAIEPELRRDWESRRGAADRDRWEELREEVRSAYNRARR